MAEKQRARAAYTLAGDYLSRAGRLEEEVRCKLQYLRALRDMTPGGLQLDKVQPGEAADPTLHRAVKMEELREEIEELYAQIERIRSENAHLIAALPDARLRSLLEMRYLSGFKWDVIAQNMFVTPRSALRMHQRALKTMHALLLERRAQRMK